MPLKNRTRPGDRPLDVKSKRTAAAQRLVDRDERQHGRKRHLEADVEQAFGKKQQNERRRQHDVAQRERRAVEQHGEEHDGDHDGRADGGEGEPEIIR